MEHSDIILPNDIKSVSCSCIFNHRPLFVVEKGEKRELTEDEIVELKVAYYLTKFPNGV